MSQFANVYLILLLQLLDQGVEEVNARTGAKILIIRGGTSFKLNISDDYLPTCGVRKTWPHVAAAELAWCLMGHDNIGWLKRHTQVWNQFADHTDNCGIKLNNSFCTCKCEFIDAAYGHRWRYKFGRDQLQLAIDALKADPTDRRIWISSWDPSTDGLGAKLQKTVPCPVGFTFSIVDGHLDSTFVLRSSDVFMGLPHDVARHAYLMKAVAMTLKIQPGVMQVSIAHPHLYEDHWELARTCLKQDVVDPCFSMPFADIDLILKDPDSYVLHEKDTASLVTWPTYNPKVKVNA